MILKPAPQEYPDRFEAYIGLVDENDLVQILRQDRNCTHNFFIDIEKEMLDYRYAEGKWSIKEVLMHINYVERIMQHRAFAASRGDMQTALAPINHDAYIDNSEIHKYDLEDLLEEFNVIRNYTIELFSNLSERQALLKMGDGENAISARAIGYALIGHARHHMDVINVRYLNIPAHEKSNS